MSKHYINDNINDDKLVKRVLIDAIVYKARLNKSGKSYYVYLPRRYNNTLTKIHDERGEVRVIVLPIN